MRKNCFIFLLPLLMIGCSNTSIPEQPEKVKKLVITDKSTIVCFGDSLTYGHGADSIDDSYPRVMQQWIKIPVINAGLNDDTTENAKDRFQRDVLEKNPVIILFDFGGNDIYSRKPSLSINRIETNFRSMLNQINFETTQVYIIRYYNSQMRFLDIFFSFDKMLNRLEKDYDIKIIRNVWDGVWGKKDLKYNMTHPNSKGYKIIAKNIFEEIKPVLEYNNMVK